MVEVVVGGDGGGGGEEGGDGVSGGGGGEGRVFKCDSIGRSHSAVQWCQTSSL